MRRKSDRDKPTGGGKAGHEPNFSSRQVRRRNSTRSTGRFWRGSWTKDRSAQLGRAGFAVDEKIGLVIERDLNNALEIMVGLQFSRPRAVC
jgi:hypothetical protein